MLPFPGPFKFDGGCDEAFATIESFSQKLDEIEVQVDQFRELEDLFELQPTAYVEIGETRSEIKQLTLLWEFKQSVDDVFQAWRKELWADVNTVDLEDQNKQLRKQLKEKGNAYLAMKGWQVYRDIDESLAVMATVLPLVHDLHSESIRTRHCNLIADRIVRGRKAAK